MTIPDPLAEATFRSAVLDWDARNTPEGAQAACAGARSAGDAAQGDRAAARRREAFGSARADEGGCPECQLVARRRQDAQPARQSVRRPRASGPGNVRPGARSGAATPGDSCRRGRCSGASERDDAALDSDRDLPSPAHAELRLRPTRPRSCLICKALGISHLYASPFLKARPGSTHGYDIVDHNALNPELGGEEAFARLSRRARRRRISGSILDFVPNHMGVQHADNAWWLDVLEWGPKSPYAASFDIDWEARCRRVRAAACCSRFSDSLTARRWSAARSSCATIRREGSFSAWYYEHRLPIAPQPLRRDPAEGGRRCAAGDEPAGRQLLELAARYRGAAHPPAIKRRPCKAELTAIAAAGEVIERGLAAYRPRSARSDRAPWRPAPPARAPALPARALAACRQRDQLSALFRHQLAGRDCGSRTRARSTPFIGSSSGSIAQGHLQGLRLDHIDGLRDPQQYFRRLQRLIEADGSRSGAFYVIVEKILADGERMPRFAGVAGTTGYEWLNLISRVLLDERGLDALEQTWREASGDERSFEDVLIEAKRRVIANILASEFTVLARLLARIAAGHYTTRDYAAERLRTAFELFLLHFPIYRTYVTASGPSGGSCGHRRDHRQGARGLVRSGRRDLRFPARCAHARSDCSGAGAVTALRASTASPSRSSNSPGR